jgi:putative hydrolase of the HAD superfamily
MWPMARADSYDGYIFDYGGVLAHHQTDADQARLAGIAAIPRERFFSLYWDTRLEYDKGNVTAEEYWGNIGRGGGTTLSSAVIERIVDADNRSWMQFDQIMWDWIAELRAAGKRVAMLSNMPRDLGEALASQTDRLRAFDHVTLSYDVRSAKPEPAIYEHCLAGIGTAPERTIFFDDRVVNVQGAESLGLRGVEFLNRDDVLSRLRG